MAINVSCNRMKYWPLIYTKSEHFQKGQRRRQREQSGAVVACWAHNPEVRGSKPRSAKRAILFFFCFASGFFLISVLCNTILRLDTFGEINFNLLRTGSIVQAFVIRYLLRRIEKDRLLRLGERPVTKSNVIFSTGITKIKPFPGEINCVCLSKGIELSSRTISLA